MKKIQDNLRKTLKQLQKNLKKKKKKSKFARIIEKIFYSSRNILQIFGKMCKIQKKLRKIYKKENSTIFL